jgi:general secretion pathway protein B
MSYILDALKRADAERERGHVPGLHSQSPSALTPPPGALRTRRGPALMTGVAVLLTVCAVAWWMFSAPGSEPAPPSAVQAPLPEPTSATHPAAMAEAPPHPPAPALPILAPAPLVAPSPAGPAPAAAPLPGTQSDSAASGAPAGAAPALPPGAPGKGKDKVPSFAELPPETRAQLPQVNVSGSTYSTNPAHRMLIANGKVVREGEEIAPGLQLETIGPRSAVLNHVGTRYSIGF